MRISKGSRERNIRIVAEYYRNYGKVPEGGNFIKL